MNANGPVLMAGMACRQSSEVHVTLTGPASAHSHGAAVRRLVQGLKAQKHWVVPFTEGFLGIHILRDLRACAQEALQLTTAAAWWQAVT